MSERIFECNGLYVTSVAAPGEAGPVLEFCQSVGTSEPINPRLNRDEAFALLLALSNWVFCTDTARRKAKNPGLDDPNR